ncbi:unnamed protein product, partial [Amoebophrya sp. A25]
SFFAWLIVAVGSWFAPSVSQVTGAEAPWVRIVRDFFHKKTRSDGHYEEQVYDYKNIKNVLKQKPSPQERHQVHLHDSLRDAAMWEEEDGQMPSLPSETSTSIEIDQKNVVDAVEQIEPSSTASTDEKPAAEKPERIHHVVGEGYLSHVVEDHIYNGVTSEPSSRRGEPRHNREPELHVFAAPDINNDMDDAIEYAEWRRETLLEFLDDHKIEMLDEEIEAMRGHKNKTEVKNRNIKRQKSETETSTRSSPAGGEGGMEAATSGGASTKNVEDDGNGTSASNYTTTSE